MEEKFVTKKSLGQHFLNSDTVPRWLVDAANIEKGETVVEIGPGTGALTKELLVRGAKVVALETDARAIEYLEKNFSDHLSSGEFTVVDSDVRQLDLGDLGLLDRGFKIVANIPYYLSGYLFRSCLSGKIQPKSLVFLVQKEVAKRATTNLERGEKESLLSLSIKAFGEPLYIRSVSRGHFTPPPKVESGIVLVQNINRNNFKDLPEDFFFKILHLGFGQKRKQLLGNLAHNYAREELENVFKKLDLEPNVRAEDLSLESWLQLTKELENTKEKSAE